ncbi:hypothetical protein H2248_002604 [Termitomyces sp. 'cryptogamus']|nr:hypothetical protein H2248_002604 [Termitomyces sp. 'cryptogamus']
MRGRRVECSCATIADEGFLECSVVAPRLLTNTIHLMFSELAELSRNSSVISSSDSESSLGDRNDARPPRTFAAPRSQSARQLPEYIQRGLGGPASSSAAAAISAHDFAFGDILGHGSYSTVIEGRARKSGRAYAIKVLDKAHLQRHNQRRTAYAEKDALLVLGTAHPGIVGLHSTFSDPWSLYFVLDLLPNGDLRALIVRYGSLSLACTRYYIAQLADALAYIHSKGVMHRDVKPENLLLDAHFRLALADFGTAKVLSPDVSRSSTFVGSPQYSSPELLSSSHTCPASDLWALGCVLFEFHSGTFAFNGPSPLLTWRLVKALSYTIPDPFDTDAADLVRRLLLLEPADRLGANDMSALKSHPFFSSIDWPTIWQLPHPPLESGLKLPPEPVTPISSDQELSAQLREERMQDEDADDIPWAKDARIAAYLPGLRHMNTMPPVQPVGDYKFPRLGPNEDGLPYEVAIQDPPTEADDAPVEQTTPPDTTFVHLLQPNERLILCTPLVPESSTPGPLVRLLPRLLTGSLRGKKPRLKERVLLLTDRRVLCVTDGAKSPPTIKADYPLSSLVKGVEARGDDGVTILTNDTRVAYAFDELGAQEKWVRNIRGMLRAS